MRDSLTPSYRKCVEQLYDEYKNVMFSTALGIVKDSVHAEDIVQFAFLRIIKHIEKINSLPHNEMKGYIVLVIRNLSIDFLRKRKHEKVVSIECMEYGDDDSVEEIALANLEMGRIRDNLKAMDNKYSLPLIMKYSLGFTYIEIADMLGISADNAKIRCHRGKRILMDAISREAAE